MNPIECQHRFTTTANGKQLRWSPPIPKVQIGLVTRVLIRKLKQATPESLLVVAMIVQAIDDCLAGEDRHRQEARRFLRGPRLEYWADLLDIEAEFVRMVAVRGGYLLDEALLWEPKTSRQQTMPSNGTGGSVHAGLQ